MPSRISVHAPATPDELAIIDSGLSEFNRGCIPPGAVQPLHVIATDEGGTVIGGAVGRTWGQCCELQQLWVALESRGFGEGTRLMDEFEREAAKRGCDIVYLETFSFQALEFYVKRGYSGVLQTAGFTDGIVKTAMQKRLVGIGN